jgi:hypothetical protein
MSAAENRQCFVIMGYGKKTDFERGRTLDLDKSYRSIIKPAVERCGLECVRADEVQHTGVIDVVMYERLLTARVVVADLSTMNPNALYELGVRHALRPYTTIVLCEDRVTKYPFDISHNVVMTYHHLGEGIDYDEVLRVQNELQRKIDGVLARPVTDSPVYTFLESLGKFEPPTFHFAGARGVAPGGAEEVAESTAQIRQRAEEAFRVGDFVRAETEYGRALKNDPDNAYLIQRRTLIAYESELPTPAEALNRAESYLAALEPGSSRDPETLGLAAAIAKRRFRLTGDTAHLANAIGFLEQGYCLKRDFNNGVNLAFLRTLRADVGGGTEPERIADLVEANRRRREVLAICAQKRPELQPGSEDLFWLEATAAEASLALADAEGLRIALRKTEEVLRALPGETEGKRWMIDTCNRQFRDLLDILRRRGGTIGQDFSGWDESSVLLRTE